MNNEYPPSQPQYNLWNSPRSSWDSKFARIKVTPEIQEAIDKSEPPSEEEIEKLTRPFRTLHPTHSNLNLLLD